MEHPGKNPICDCPDPHAFDLNFPPAQANVASHHSHSSREAHSMGQRPAHVKAPAYLSKSPPVPAPQPLVRAPEPNPERPDPVRYGDWERNGIAIDF